jgi:hypothetical protein
VKVIWEPGPKRVPEAEKPVLPSPNEPISPPSFACLHREAA